MANNVLQGYVTRICEIYIDDVLLFGTTDDEYIDNTRNSTRYADFSYLHVLLMVAASSSLTGANCHPLQRVVKL